MKNAIDVVLSNKYDVLEIKSFMILQLWQIFKSIPSLVLYNTNNIITDQWCSENSLPDRAKTITINGRYQVI